ncbi:hypothetical protein HDE_07068 [Halotydeus destructor]|nr:hypothetical protein HDE_07068 [Halotydeus destructor]
MTFTSFIIYISGIFGLWYGVDVYGLKRIAVKKLKQIHWNVLLSGMLVVIALTHLTIETNSYLDYPTTSLTVYEHRDEIPCPKLSLRRVVAVYPPLPKFSAVILNQLYSIHWLAMVIMDPKKRRQVYYDQNKYK